MPPRLPPNFYKTVGKLPTNILAKNTPTHAGVAKDKVKRSVGNAPVIHVPGVGTVTINNKSATVVPPTIEQSAEANPSDSVAQRSDILCRSDAPVLKKAKKASLELAIAAATTAESRTAALEDFEFDKVANSARAARASIWHTWVRMHQAWFGDTVSVLPLTVSKIKAVAALFKAGNYTSFANYASRAKAEHVDQFHVHAVPWTEELTVEIKGALRSITRGRGPSKQSCPIDLGKIIKLGNIEAPVVDEGPIGMSDLMIIGTFFMARELELSCAKCSHLFIDVIVSEVTWNMPVAKNDMSALGTYRTWGCLCGTAVKVGCPFHAALRQLDRVRAIASDSSASLSDLPLFPDKAGQVVTKARVVASITKVMENAGQPTKDSMDRPLYGGHSLRTGGAVLLASLGIDTTRIEAMARWNSPMLLYYIRSAPLKSITCEYKLLADAQRTSGTGASSSSTAHSLDKLGKVVVDFVRRLDSAEEARQVCIDRIDALEAKASRNQFILNCTSGVWHFTRDHCAGKHCYTACGWQYTGLQFDVRASLPEGLKHKAVCGTCLPATRLLEMMD